MPKHTILLVDDEPSILEALSNILTEEHYNVIQSLNGLSAMHLLKKHQDEIHLVITDIKMPRMDGIELIKRMHTFLHTPMAVIILSGFYTVTNDTLKLGTGEYVILYDALLKPPDLNALLILYKKLLRLR
jgi:YesN/AraC family two-component response regulator